MLGGKVIFLFLDADLNLQKGGAGRRAIDYVNCLDKIQEIILLVYLQLQ